MSVVSWENYLGQFHFIYTRSCVYFIFFFIPTIVHMKRTIRETRHLNETSTCLSTRLNTQLSLADRHVEVF